MQGEAQRDRTEEILRYIAEGTASSTGDDFFRDLTRYLAAALGVKWAFVSEFTEVRTRVCMIAFWDGAGFAAPFEYDLAHTPCENVLLGEVGYYPENVQARFPLHHHLVELGVESYLAVPMVNRAGEVIGHLGAMDIRPMRNQTRDLNIFRIFGARAAAELERKQAEERLDFNRQCLSTILSTAMDAIITVNQDHRITLFNRAAEQMFRCSAEWAIGQPIERFVARRQRGIFDSFMRDGETQSATPRYLWMPEGLAAQRSDGEEFPIEATFSPQQCGDHRMYTFILRDINERTRAEAALQALRAQNQSLQEEIRRQHEFAQVIGESPLMHELFGNVARVAGADTTVLVTGETGSGKELIAHAIHAASSRKDRTLVTVNCAALPAELIESELFGHERGAFTGATVQRKGRFELADGGSIFLDEVGELTAQAQAKLLRILQERQFERVGGSQPIKVDVRVIAATNRRLEEMVAAGSFRADLYYRLNVFPLHVPPLRERPEDIPLLARHFVIKFSRRLGKPLDGIAPLSLERLRRYHWPGNVRELQNVIERAAILSAGTLLEIHDLQLDEAAAATAATPPSGTLDDIARQHIERVLAACGGVIEGPQGAAASLGLKPSTLRYRMQQLGVANTTRRARHSA